MANLLFRITKEGRITHRYINEQFTHKTPSLIQQFLPKDAIDRVIEAMHENLHYTLHEEIVLNEELHTACLYQVGNQYLFYITPTDHYALKRSIPNLLKTISDLILTPHKDDSNKTTFLYESMQKLNNELINKQREIMKQSEQLNRLNKLLNDRLIKDPLTSLISRHQYIESITQAINESPNAFGLFWFIDLDDFKLVNDQHGHQVGDQFLIEVANRLESLPFENTLKMRIAGDEFGLFMHNVSDISKASIEALYQTFITHFKKPITLDSYTLACPSSTGIAIYNHDTNDIEKLIEYADFAMYQAKQKGNDQMALFNQTVFKAQTNQKAD